ncbi:MAG: orotidine-5'-phosphate decarboxylase [Phycisphaerales bacterium]|nr:orotidine-5'-phosphate decarboxylase [Phycisphaerales bacterium]
MSNSTVAVRHPADHLNAAIDAAGAPVCVGLDPVLDRLPAGGETARDPARAIRDFCLLVIDAVASVVPAVKIQSACFERYGAAGVAACGQVIDAARERDLVVILDAKRGDIGVSAEHYAAATLGGTHPAHWVTVNAYLGDDGLAPFVAAGGAFALVRTSNPGGDAIQMPRLENGLTVAEHVGSVVAALGASSIGATGYSALGAVVGATKASEAGALRAVMPEQVFLVPGVGAQGGSIEALRELFDANGHGALITASRSVIYAGGDADAPSAGIRDAAARLADDVGRVAGLR